MSAQICNSSVIFRIFNRPDIFAFVDWPKIFFDWLFFFIFILLSCKYWSPCWTNMHLRQVSFKFLAIAWNYMSQMFSLVSHKENVWQDYRYYHTINLFWRLMFEFSCFLSALSDSERVWVNHAVPQWVWTDSTQRLKCLRQHSVISLYRSKLAQTKLRNRFLLLHWRLSDYMHMLLLDRMFLHSILET